MADHSRRDAAIAFLKLAASGRVREAYERHVDPRFRHHNPYFRGNAASLMAGMEQNAKENPEKVLDVILALEDGDRVGILSRVRHKPDDLGAAVVHFFRFDGERIVELWDVGQEIPEDAVNEYGMF